MPVSRRTLLKFTAFAGLSVWLQACADDESAEFDPDAPAASSAEGMPRILVIGAGIAGLAAAAKLRQAGAQVQVLEGRTRIGGRIWTSHAWADQPVDMGASWIHGVDDNPISALAERVAARRVATDYDNSEVYVPGGEELSEAQIDTLESQAQELLEAVAELVEDTDDMALATAIQQILADLPEQPDLTGLNFVLNTAIEHEYAADASELSAQYWDSGEELDGGDVLFPEGYEQILKPLLEQLDIQTGQRVTAIDYSGASVRVQTEDAVFEADKVIVTVPLGVLKQGVITFTPPLGADKTTAIERLGSGLLNKTWLRFPTAFWPREPEIINYIDPQKGRWAEFLNIYHYTGTPILLGFNAGEYARELEQRSDAEIIADCMAVLDSLFDGAVEPEAWQITRWGSDEFAYGAYSFLGVDATNAMRETLAAPLGGHIFFAGEATSSEYAATVHGAYLSGLRAASEALDE